MQEHDPFQLPYSIEPTDPDLSAALLESIAKANLTTDPRQQMDMSQQWFHANNASNSLTAIMAADKNGFAKDIDAMLHFGNYTLRVYLTDETS